MKCIRATFASVAAIVCTAAWAGPYDQVYSLVETGDRKPAQRHDTIALARIDGKSPRNPRKSDPLTPGKHSIEVSYSTARAVVTDDLKMLDIETEPCKRYRIVAHYESDRSPKWEPVVQQVEEIGECKRKFMSDKTKK